MSLPRHHKGQGLVGARSVGLFPHGGRAGPGSQDHPTAPSREHGWWGEPGAAPGTRHFHARRKIGLLEEDRQGHLWVPFSHPDMLTPL